MRKRKYFPKKFCNSSLQKSPRHRHNRMDILDDLDKIFQLALKAGDFKEARKAKELIGKEMGLFLPPGKRIKPQLADLSETELMEVLSEGEEDCINLRHQLKPRVCEDHLIQKKLEAQKDLYAEKRLQREQENREFEEKQRKFYEQFTATARSPPK